MNTRHSNGNLADPPRITSEEQRFRAALILAVTNKANSPVRIAGAAAAYLRQAGRNDFEKMLGAKIDALIFDEIKAAADARVELESPVGILTTLDGTIINNGTRGLIIEKVPDRYYNQVDSGIKVKVEGHKPTPHAKVKFVGHDVPAWVPLHWLKKVEAE